MFITLIVIHVLVSISLVLVVLLQTGRGAELGAAFGSVGQATFSRGAATFMSKFTTSLAVVFMLTSLSLAYLSAEKPGQSILSPSTLTPAPSGQEGGAVSDQEAGLTVPLPPLQQQDAAPFQPLEQTDAPPESQQ